MMGTGNPVGLHFCDALEERAIQVAQVVRG